MGFALGLKHETARIREKVYLGPWTWHTWDLSGLGPAYTLCSIACDLRSYCFSSLSWQSGSRFTKI